MPEPTSNSATGGISRFVTELRQRNVFRVAAAYAICGWLVIQLTSNIFPTFDFPQWTNQFVILLVLIGFPIALVLAWAFEITPEGLKRSASVERTESIAPHTGKKINMLIITSLSLLVVFMFVERVFFQNSAPVPVATREDTSSTLPSSTISDKSIAVLPFDDFDAGGEDAYFADGLTEEILNSVARIPDLLVASRTSSFQYKDKTLDLREIAAELGVAHILEGSVRQSSSRLRVTAQLIRASDGFHIWSENYDRQPDDIIAVQEDIAVQIATALQTVMDPQALRTMVQSGTRSVPAYNAYLKGISYGSRQLEKSYVFIEQARQLDPEFAVAHYRAATYWSEKLRATIDYERSTLSPAQMLAMYHERISRAIETSVVPEQYLYRSNQARVNLQLRASLSFLRQYLQAQSNRNVTTSVQIDAIHLAQDLSERELALQFLEKVPSSSLDVDDYNWMLFAYRRMPEYEGSYKFAMEAISKFPNDEGVLYQVNDLLNWAGYRDDARTAAERITVTLLPLENVLLAQLRQACADGNSVEANRLYENEMKDISSTATKYIALNTLGRSEEAHELLMPMDQDSSLYTLSSYLMFPYFDPRLFPNLQRVLEREQVLRAPVIPLSYACK